MTQNPNLPTHCETFSVPACHPALPGHFPGAPVVPGVVMLDRVVAAIERVWKLRVSGLPQVKFLAPLLPHQQATLKLTQSDQSVKFSIARDAAIVASGVVEVVR